VQREFRAARPDQLWVVDLTYLRTWAGFGYLALVVDVFSRRIVGWALTTHMRTELAAGSSGNLNDVVKPPVCALEDARPNVGCRAEVTRAHRLGGVRGT
jgi:hypothetical protein